MFQNKDKDVIYALVFVQVQNILLNKVSFTALSLMIANKLLQEMPSIGTQINWQTAHNQIYSITCHYSAAQLLHAQLIWIM